jgi:dienelactone hydrolase
MIGNVILPSTSPEEWTDIKKRLKDRIEATFGEASEKSDTESQFKEVEEYDNYGLKHIKIQYRIFKEDWNEAVIVLPGKEKPKDPVPGILVVHGTNGKEGKNGVLKKDQGPDGPYAVELADYGYVTMAVDQFGFGATIENTDQKDLISFFYKKHPEWTLDGRRLLEQKLALSIMESLDYVDSGRLGVIGHSLGGRAAVHLGCLDERIKACVASSGISPNCTNIYRRITWSEPQNPIISKYIKDNFGKVPWDYHEMIALCAPRPFLAIEPYNDDYNPDMMTNYACIQSASEVYGLLDMGKCLSLVAHGEGHGTSLFYREIAYQWFDEFLKNT